MLHVVAFAGLTSALDNGLARLPAMGYSTWSSFGCHINASDVAESAKKMVEFGLDKLGYEYVNIDDCWMNPERVNGRLVANPKLFPDGMKALADEIHDLGFKFGIYTARGPKTCQGYPASYNHTTVDAQSFAEWGVDYVKEDGCSAPDTVAEQQYTAMRDALNATGRPIYFSLCGGFPTIERNVRSLGNSWRISHDVTDWVQIYHNARVNENLTIHAGPGGWNDPDMIGASNNWPAHEPSPTQGRTQFTLWCYMAAPLLISADLTTISDWDLETFTNTELIAIDQDPLGHQAFLFYHEGCPPVDQSPAINHTLGRPDDCLQGWIKYLENGDIGIAVVNWGYLPRKFDCRSDCLAKIASRSGSGHLVKIDSVRDLWSGEKFEEVTEIEMMVKPNTTRAFRGKPTWSTEV